MSHWADEGYELMTTEQMLEALNAGCELELVPVRGVSEDVLEHYGDAERAALELEGSENDVVSVEYVDDEEVQCILVDDPEHLYLTDMYISTHNTSNIIFLKSTDDSLLDTLSKISGTRHVTRADGKTITRDVTRIFNKNEEKISINVSTKEEPVISFNDMVNIPERNAIVFRAGDAPVWDRNELVLPMSWRLFLNKIVHPGHDYTLQTIPTLSTAIDFDVRKNMPDFASMLDKRIAQALKVEEAEKIYRETTGKSEVELARMDPDLRAEEVMGIVNGLIAADEEQKAIEEAEREAKEARENFARASRAQDPRMAALRQGWAGAVHPAVGFADDAEDNEEVLVEAKKASAAQAALDVKRFCGGRLSPGDLYNPNAGANHHLDQLISTAFSKCKQQFIKDREHFRFVGGTLSSPDGSVTYLEPGDAMLDALTAETYVDDPSARVFAEDKADVKRSAVGSMQVTDEFLRYLASLPNWKGIAGGRFESVMTQLLIADDDATILSDSDGAQTGGGVTF